ncbi:PREDICTED: uncharacterized protein LOC109583480 [Amphimedon queenslandica]|uniref:Uncharacterized protein n=1 Tax=Amphimedon queenslandica TaxID=400682 RepID=A0A1X7UG99_AMPQE|nr:PREDICTED: uncharacterized protein LOC109583480 [Amphimedon queenslandica]|eukprot:XP_019854419.1 PREDICTED: uncharacterized protein LOC109583480 [Amphimedon queenslandica]
MRLSSVCGSKIVFPYFSTLNFHVNGQSSDTSCEHKDGVTIRQLDTATMVSVISLVHETDKAVHLYCVNNVSKQTVLDYTLKPGVLSDVNNLTLDFTLNDTLQMYWSQPSNVCQCDRNESCDITYKVSFDEDPNGLEHVAHGPYFELPRVSKFDALSVEVIVPQNQTIRCVPATTTLSTSNDTTRSAPQNKKLFLFIAMLLVVACSPFCYKIWICYIKACLLVCYRLYHFIMKKRNAKPLLPIFDTPAHPCAFIVVTRP